MRSLAALVLVLVVGCNHSPVSTAPDDGADVAAFAACPAAALDVAASPAAAADVAACRAAIPRRMPVARFNLAAAATPDGRVYLVGGAMTFGSAGNAALAVYEPKTATFRSLAAAPAPFKGQPAATVSSGILLVADGASLWRYNPGADCWSAGAPPRAPLYNRAAATGADRLAYFFGGLSETGGVVPDADTYDPVADRWAALPPMPFPADGLAAAAAPDRIWVVGPDTASFDPVARSWTKVPAPATPRYWLGAATDGRRLFALGGYPRGGIGSSGATEIYEPETGRWASGAPLITSVAQMGAAVACGRVLVFGGNSNGRIVDIMQLYDMAADRWVESP